MYIDTNGFELGDRVKDTITGYTGVIIGMSQWTTGCARASVQAPVDKDGKVPDSIGIDVLTLEMVKAGPRHDADRSKGGPRPEPNRRPDARR